MRKFAGFVLLLALTGPAAAQGVSATAQAAISQYRTAHGLSAVKADGRLMALAAEQARAMARTGVLDHSAERPFATRVASYNPDVAVENIAGGTTTFAATLELWKHSPGHDANLRRQGVTRFGIASAPAPGSKYRMFWALILAGGGDGHPGIRQAGAPGVLRAAPLRPVALHAGAVPLRDERTAPPF